MVQPSLPFNLSLSPSAGELKSVDRLRHIWPGIPRRPEDRYSAVPSYGDGHENRARRLHKEGNENGYHFHTSDMLDEYEDGEVATKDLHQ